MPVIRPRIRVSRVTVCCGDRTIQAASFREVDIMLTLRARRHPNEVVSFRAEWVDGRIATGTAILQGEVHLGTAIDDTWTRPAEMSDQEYAEFIREQCTLAYSGPWPLSERLEEKPRYDIGKDRTLDERTRVFKSDRW